MGCFGSNSGSRWMEEERACPKPTMVPHTLPQDFQVSRGTELWHPMVGLKRAHGKAEEESPALLRLWDSRGWEKERGSAILFPLCVPSRDVTAKSGGLRPEQVEHHSYSDITVCVCATNM